MTARRILMNTTTAALLLMTPLALTSLVHADCTWIAGDGDWDVAANWDCGFVPGSDDNATIDAAGVTVTVPELTLVDTLALKDATLNVLDELDAETFHFESGTVSGGGLLTAGNLIMDGSSRTLGGGTTLVLMGQGQWISGSIGVNTNAEIIISGSAELELSSSAGFTGSVPFSPPFLVIEEGGTFYRTGSGTSLFNSMRVVNHGTLIVGNTPPEDPGPTLAFRSQNGFPHTGRFEVLDDGTLQFQSRSDHTEDAELVGTGVVQFGSAGANVGQHTFEGDGYNFDGLTQPLTLSTIRFLNGASGSTGSLYIANAVRIDGQSGTPPQGMNPTFTVHGSFITEGNQVFFRNNIHIHALDGFDISTGSFQLESNSVLFNHGEGNLAYSSQFRLGSLGNNGNRSTLHNLPGATLNFLTNGLIRSASGFAARGGIIINEGVIDIDVDPDDEGLDALRVNGQRIINRGEIKTISGSWELNNPFALLLNDGGAISTSPVRFIDDASLGGDGTFNGSVILDGGRLRTAEAGADILPLDEPVVADLTIANDLTMDADSSLVARLFSTAGPGLGHDYVNVLGNATLDGTLTLISEGTFTSAGCSDLTVLNSPNAFEGTFAQIVSEDNLGVEFLSNEIRVLGLGADPSGDLNCDGVINVFDLLILLANWGNCPVDEECFGDLNDDDVVNVFDLLILLSNWGVVNG
ncbi:MAG: hypothetical protein EA377_08905 [Phycisphaerales bacterium]|nr:MAG: hypothetical protein EA377_08905 [Phycisphaerales bacterium]